MPQVLRCAIAGNRRTLPDIATDFPQNSRFLIPIHENPDTDRFLVGAWQCPLVST
ncbi:hypothetical protein [uncultured Nostoc sp.]